MTRLRHVDSVLRALKSQCLTVPRSNLCIRKLTLAEGQKMVLNYFGVTDCSKKSTETMKRGLETLTDTSTYTSNLT